MRLHLEYHGLYWEAQNKRDLGILEKVQHRASKVLKGLEYLSCEQRLRS